MKKSELLNFIADNNIKSPNKIIRYNELSLKVGPSNAEKLVAMLTELIAEGAIVETENGGLKAKE